MTIIPLPEACFCESCQVIIDNLHCPCCASDTHTYRIAGWLNREEPFLSLPRSIQHLSIGPARGIAPDATEAP